MQHGHKNQSSCSLPCLFPNYNRRHSSFLKEEFVMLPAKPGVYRLNNEPPGGRFTLSIPEFYSEAVPAPLVISLHYGWHGEISPFYGARLLETLVGPAFRGCGAIIGAPDCRRDNWTSPEGESDVVEFTHYLSAAYNIDPGKRILVGYSLGGIGVWYIAPRHPHLFTAAAPIAAYPGPGIELPEWKIPLEVIQSRDDEVFPLELSEKAIQSLQELGAAARLTVIKGVLHHDDPAFLPALRKVAHRLIGNCA
jgi:pimeloyl-ACP methyl ester carboxylesterase